MGLGLGLGLGARVKVRVRVRAGTALLQHTWGTYPGRPAIEMLYKLDDQVRAALDAEPSQRRLELRTRHKAVAVAVAQLHKLGRCEVPSSHHSVRPGEQCTQVQHLVLCGRREALMHAHQPSQPSRRTAHAHPGAGT